MTAIEAIRDELNVLASVRSFGGIQVMRKRLHAMKRLGSKRVFGDVRGITRVSEGDLGPVGDHPYFYHVGGRTELQFNVGIDPFDELDLRYGVAFSFEPSFSYPGIDDLLPRVQLFNDHLRQNPGEFADMRMWHYSDGERSEARSPAPLGPDLARLGTFVFMGRLGRSDEPPYGDMLETFDRLMPLWVSIEENLSSRSVGSRSITEAGRPLRRGRVERPAFATSSLAARMLDISLRHNVLQAALVDELITEHGEDRVGWEEPAPGGGYIDAVVDAVEGRTIFEIKTAASARGCLREAMGQILDYGCWPGSPVPVRMIVVGEAPEDGATRAYLARLNASFPTAIAYRQVRLSDVSQDGH